MATFWKLFASVLRSDGDVLQGGVLSALWGQRRREYRGGNYTTVV
jgi:hypothetical protein